MKNRLILRLFVLLNNSLHSEKNDINREGSERLEPQTVDVNTFEDLIESADLLLEYVGLPKELRAIARFTAEPKHRIRLEKIARLLERDIPERLLTGAKRTACEILWALAEGNYLSDEELAIKVDKSPSTVKQTICALKRGGIDFDESHAKGFRKRGRTYGKRRSLVS